MNFAFRPLVLALLTAAPLFLSPIQAKAQSEVEFDAGEMEILEADKRAIFRGDVVATRGEEVIKADEMIVNYVDVKQADGSMKTEVDTMICKGGVTITTPTQVITGSRATFHVRRDELIVSGNVVVKQGQTVIRGPELTANLKTRKTVMKGGRVKGKFVPQ